MDRIVREELKEVVERLRKVLDLKTEEIRGTPILDAVLEAHDSLKLILAINQE